jgi:hypothetical protein
MILGTLNVGSTAIADAQHHLIYSNLPNLHINIPLDIKIFNTLFKNIDCLTIEMDSSMLTFWEDILDLCK